MKKGEERQRRNRSFWGGNPKQCIRLDYVVVFCIVSSNFKDSHSTDRNERVKAGNRISVAYDIRPE